jgi:CxxC motif-containing protein (DUF1111 family)
MMNPSIPKLPAVLSALLALASLSVLAQPAPPPPAPPPAAQAAGPGGPSPGPGGFGQILSGATPAEKSAFAQGAADFTAVETPGTGLGPIFNDVACAACHAAPSVGGSSRKAVTRFGETVNGVFDPLTALDGTLLHARAIARPLQEVVPSQANVVAQRLTTPLYGAGLIEAIPDATIIANAQLPRTAGVAGRPAMVTDIATGELRVGRFGWKAQHATLLSFSGDALNNEIGITNRLFPKAAAPDGNEALLARYVSPGAPIEDLPSPVTGLSEIDRVSDYMRLLAPPPAGAPVSAASLAGQKLFAAAGCASCHTPSLNTGPNSSAALANKAVALYSDLLLHNMGPLADGIAQADAGTAEMRTAPLWGLGARAAYLHDGRATTVAEAILDHAGEAANARAAYQQLDAAEQKELLAFLATL